MDADDWENDEEFDAFDDVDDPADDDGAWWADEAAEGDETRMTSAWEFGTAAAVGGHLLDRQTERLAAALRGAIPQPAGDPPGPAPAVPSAGRPAYLDLPEAAPFDWSAQPLRVGEVLERSRLAVTVGNALAADLQLLVVPVASAGRAHPGELLDWSQLSFSIAVSSQRPRAAAVLVVFGARPHGFTPERLVPVFTSLASGDGAWVALDSAHHAVAVVEWALARWHLCLDEFRCGALHS